MQMFTDSVELNGECWWTAILDHATDFLSFDLAIAKHKLFISFFFFLQTHFIIIFYLVFCFIILLLLNADVWLIGLNSMALTVWFYPYCQGFHFLLLKSSPITHQALITMLDHRNSVIWVLDYT